ncbi:MAG: nitrilotriacetate monooxygenase [Hyphomicrobiales bacterium]|nr:nitrilotriacetate monooxygenase [Hyphomicrobiales bacterium]
MARNGMMKLGLSIRRLGYHTAAWRHPETRADSAEDFGSFLVNVMAAERAKFDLVFLADGLAIRAKDEPPGSLACSNENVELEPLTLLAAMAPLTRNIGLVATSSTTYNEPYHVARRYASLDHISGGRAGWNVVTSWSEMEALNFNREHHLDHATRYDRAKEFVEVVTGLWDSWEEGAFLRDKQSGIFYDDKKRHVLNHKGPHFQVRGPLSASRTPQGRPIIVQAGASEQGREISAESADIVYTNEYLLSAARDYYRDLKDRLPHYGREDDDLKILPGIQPIVGATRQEAQDKFDELQALIHPLPGLASLYGLLGDCSGFDLDSPLPMDAVFENKTSNAVKTLELARRENLTIRQLYQRTAGKAGIRQIIGTAADIVDDMEQWFTEEACDGFNVCPSHMPHGLDDFAAFVVPELQRRNLFRTEYEGRTLRENLGLRRHVNRYQTRR